MPTDKILTGRCGTTLVGRGRSSDSRPHSWSQREHWEFETHRGVSVYGLGRFPVTLYKEQWITLLAMTDEIRAFLTEHDAELKTKSRA